MKKTLIPVLAVAAALLMSGCSQEYLPMLDEGGQSDIVADYQVPDDVVNFDEGRDLATDDGQQHRYQILLQVDPETPVQATVGNQIQVSAIVVDYIQGQPAPDVLVDFQIVTVVDDDGVVVQGDANFETYSRYTDAKGRVSNDFFVGMVPEVTYTLGLSLPDYPESEPVTMKVKVLAYACGCLRVDFSYDGVIETPLRDIEVFVVPSTYQCGKHIFPHTVLSDDLIIAQRSAQTVNSVVTFDCLPAGATYTVFARAGSGDLVCTAAGGCSRTLVMQPETCDEMTLEFSEVTFQASGRYNAVDHFNFEPMIEMCAGGDTTIIGCITAGTEDVGKTVCCAIQELVKLFNTPGSTIVQLVFDALKLWIGSAIIDAVQTVVGKALESVLNDLILQWSRDTPWLAAFLTAGKDITQIISNLELESELVLQKLGSDYTVQGTHFWHAINLYWRMGCAAEGDPAFDPECGKYTLDMKDLTVLPDDFPMELLEGSFIADVLNFNWMSLRQHEIALSYGKLVLWAINGIFIPQISGDQAHSIDDLARLWLDCKGMANGPIGDAAETIPGVDRDDVEAVCNTVITSLIDPVDDMIGRLSLSTTLTLTGTGRMLDGNCDTIIDSIVDGTYIGFVESNSQQASVTGDWSAVRIVEDE
ncbi:MAG TPA: hypothetical protein PLB35_07750 [Myxococcota bacterium]|nr:hypothetical protein [Myxococcota bacterium]HNZ03052.1 hypothetical protein [Myxococcota bacterium]HNZ03141.1 hypothetical protein [Myxococcota bacterium]HOH77135.1 hypothetical protein [Myxococcota bacterium]HPV03398.1 hypothetical protein [Myxococcota bacterium]